MSVNGQSARLVGELIRHRPATIQIIKLRSVIFSPFVENNTANLLKNGKMTHPLTAPSALKLCLNYTRAFEDNQGESILDGYRFLRQFPHDFAPFDLAQGGQDRY
jgi:hypothetical protein